MILGKIAGKTSTTEVKFSAEGNADKFEYIQVLDKNDNYVLCQIVEIERHHGKGIAYCNIIGYRDKAKRLRGLRTPLEPGTEVLYADDKFVKKTLGLEKSRNAAFIGTLEGRDKVEVFLDLNKLLTRHVAVLAKTGAGKCVNPKTKITLNDGSRVKIGNFVDKHLKYGFKRSKDVEFVENNDPNLKVVCLGEDYKVSSSKINTFMRRKAPEVMYSMVTKSGQEIELTPEHPVPVIRDEGLTWIPVSKLAKEDYVLLPKVQIKGSKQKVDLIDMWKNSNKVRVDDKEVIQLIKSKIKEKNIDFKYLSKKLNFSINAIRRWFKSSGIPLKQLIKLSQILGIDFDGLKEHISSLRRVQKILPSFIEISKDFAKLLGYMLAEGHNTKEVISFTNYSKDIQEDYSRLVKNVFKIKTSTISRKNVLMIYNLFLAKSLEKIGFTNSSWTKFIPEEIIKSEKPVLYAFLSSFIDCDGHVCKNSPAVEICLANGPLVNDLEFILIRLGIIARHHEKIINNKKYGKLSINGASYLSQIYQKTNFLIKHKRQRLKEYSNLNSNTNLNIVPNINLVIRQLMYLLRMSYSMTGITSINRYINYKGNPSFGSLSALLESFEARYKELEEAITEIKSLYVNMPCIDENYALDILQKAYNQGTSFCKIAASTKVSSTTARRIVRGITKPTNNIYKLANNVSRDDNIESVLSLNLNKISMQLDKLCEKIGHEKKELCLSAGRCKQLLYGHKTKNIVPLYSLVYDLTKKLFEASQLLEDDLVATEEKIKYLHQLANSNLFFDQISFIKRIKSNCKYVYDLETEDHNFVANNLLIHNSYTVGVLLEELLENKIPILIIDPHGEYSTLKNPNDEDKDGLKKLGINPKGYSGQIQEFSPDTQTNSDCKPLKLSAKNLSPPELIHMLPAKLSNAQLSIMYSALKNLGNKADFDELLLELENEEGSGKWTLINILEYVKKLNLFSDAPTPLFELVKTNKASIINLKGVSPEVQEVVVYKLVKDLFTERKKGNIPPFFLVLEEGHNFIPERTYGEAKSSSILRQIFSEGRKFGLGVCLISQRPSRVEKNALSQVNTQIILKITNPNDVKAVGRSVEGITSETEKEIKNIPIGTALVTGVVDMPIFVNIRTRRSKHGGAAVKILGEEIEEEKDFVSEAKKGKGELLPLIKQKVSLKDLKLMGKKKLKVVLAPCVFLSCSDKQGDFNLLVNLNNGHVVTKLKSGEGVPLKGFKLEDLSPQQKKVMKIAFDLKEFKPAEIFSKSGLQFSDLYETIKTLSKKGFFVKSGDKYSLSDSLSLFANIRDNAFYSKVDYSRLEFDEQLEKKVDVINLVEFLGRFFEIKNEKECWLVLYK